MIRRVPLPENAPLRLTMLTSNLEAEKTSGKLPGDVLLNCISTMAMDMTMVKRMASSIADPDYTLKMFYRDLQAFPELVLYLLEEGGESRTMGDELQRTVGAFFAIYWLMRVD